MLDSRPTYNHDGFPVSGNFEVYHPINGVDNEHRKWVEILSKTTNPARETGITVPASGFKLSLLPEDVVKTAFESSSARDASLADIRQVISKSRKIYSSFRLRDVSLVKETFEQSNPDGTSSFIWATEDARFHDEREAFIDNLQSGLGVFIDSTVLPRNPSIEIAHMNPAVAGERTFEEQLRPRVLGSIRMFHPDFIDVSPLVAFGQSFNHSR